MVYLCKSDPLESRIQENQIWFGACKLIIIHFKAQGYISHIFHVWDDTKKIKIHKYEILKKRCLISYIFNC